MSHFRTRFGLVTTCEALTRYPRIHLVGRRAVEAIWSGSGRVPVVVERLTCGWLSPLQLIHARSVLEPTLSAGYDDAMSRLTWLFHLLLVSLGFLTGCTILNRNYNRIRAELTKPETDEDTHHYGAYFEAPLSGFFGQPVRRGKKEQAGSLFYIAFLTVERRPNAILGRISGESWGWNRIG